MDYPKETELDVDERSAEAAVMRNSVQPSKIRLTLPAPGCCVGRIAGRKASEMSALEIPEHIQLALLKSERG